jgi:hypothetical protein
MARSYEKADRPDPSKYVSRAEAAKMLGVPDNRILPMIKDGLLVGLQRGKWWYVSRDSIAYYKAHPE